MNTANPNPHNPYAPPTAPVQDIAATSGTRELASRGSRLGAMSIDGLVGLVLCLPPLFVAFSHWDTSVYFLLNFINGGLAVSVVLAIAWIVVTIILVARNGQTIGKRAVGIKVVRTDGSKASLGRIFWLRNVVNALVGVVVSVVLSTAVGAAAGFSAVGMSAATLMSNLYSILDPALIFGATRQCLHDRIADTIVVKA
jgi:uncharacterized RDD family membrane protein YckC